MTYESLELVELGTAEVVIELFEIATPEESDSKFIKTVEPYVEYDE